MSHTPGPWRVVGSMYGDFSVVQVEKRPHIGQVVIADNITQGVNEGIEDARLIAAAPDLLEVLREVNNRYSSLMTEKMQNKIKDAIKKATA